MMQRSSRFLSLSGLSGIAAGFWALVGSYFAYQQIHNYYVAYNSRGYSGVDFQSLKLNLIFIASAVLVAALLSALYFHLAPGPQAQRFNLEPHLKTIAD